MSHLYRSLRLPLSASSREVVKAAAKALHPGLRRMRALRLARRRYYRDMLNEHEAAQAAARQSGP
ncbi:MAG: hypothetical protein KDK53_01430 [Maritimibacter sp.]|nr:hypothetical protein [Maritimibacter sp.]